MQDEEIDMLQNVSDALKKTQIDFQSRFEYITANLLILKLRVNMERIIKHDENILDATPNKLKQIVKNLGVSRG